MNEQPANRSIVRRSLLWVSLCVLSSFLGVGCGGKKPTPEGPPKKPNLVVENDPSKKPEIVKKIPKKPQVPSTPKAEGVKFQATVSWTAKKFAGGRKPFPRMRVTIDATGGDAAKTFRYGHLTITKITNQRDEMLKVLPQSTVKPAPDWNIFKDMVSKPMSPFTQLPKDGVRFGILVRHPVETPKKLSSLQGRLRFETVRPKVMKLDNVANRIGTNLEAPELLETDTSVELAKEYLVLLKQSWKKGQNPISQVALRNKNRELIEPERTADQSAFGDQKTAIHRWRLSPQLKGMADLEIVLAKNKTKPISFPLAFKSKIDHPELNKVGVKLAFTFELELKVTVVGKNVMDVVVRNSKGNSISRNQKIVYFPDNSKFTLSAPVSSPADELQITLATNPKVVEAAFDLKDIAVPPIPRKRP